MNIDDLIHNMVIGLLVAVFVLLLGLGGYSIYGRFTQEELITITVVDKEIDTGLTCTTIDETTSCHPYTHFLVYSDVEKFYIDDQLYDEVQVGKTHVFHVRGWVHDRRIDEVLE